MRLAVICMLICAPITALGATYTVGVDVGRASASGVACPPLAGRTCRDKGDAWRVYYGFARASGIGARITHTQVSDLVSDLQSGDTFRLSKIDDLAVTYSYPFSDLVSISAKAGIARWEESRPGVAFFSSHSMTGESPALGLNVDFGNRLFRAGLSVDLYPSIGDADNVLYYGAGLRLVW